MWDSLCLPCFCFPALGFDIDGMWKIKDVQVSLPNKDIVYKGNRCKFVLQDAVDFMNRKP